VESILAQLMLRSRDTHGYVFRPCIVAGPRAQALLEEMPFLKASEQLPAAARRVLDSLPVVKPVIPDPGIPFQFVHEDDVASAFAAGVLGRGAPGPYNLAGTGTLGMSDVAEELGWYSMPIPQMAVEATAEVLSRMPALPEAFAWIHTLRQPVLMRTERAERELGWTPRYSGRDTLRALVAARQAGG